MIYAQLEGGVRSRQAHIREDSPESDVVGITFTTLHRIMTQTKPDELLALYCFYAKETKRQKTQRVYATTAYVARGLHWKPDKVRKVKKRLMALGMIEDYQPRDEKGKIGKPYIVVRFIANPSTLPQIPEGGFEGSQMLTDSKGSAYRKKSKESKETSPVGDEFEAQWKPNIGTKEEKLKLLKRPRKYPSEWEFENFIEEHGLDNLTTYRPDLYHRLCVSKWHEWRAELEKWVPITDWRKYITALSNHIENVF